LITLKDVLHTDGAGVGFALLHAVISNWSETTDAVDAVVVEHVVGLFFVKVFDVDYWSIKDDRWSPIEVELFVVDLKLILDYDALNGQYIISTFSSEKWKFYLES
jgi:hypothetical protein